MEERKILSQLMPKILLQKDLFPCWREVVHKVDKKAKGNKTGNTFNAQIHSPFQKLLAYLSGENKNKTIITGTNTAMV